MALTPQELAANSRCLDCIPAGLRDAVIIYLLNQLANMATPQELVTAARCYDCIPVGLRSAVITYLQDEILSGGGGGGGGNIEVWSLAGSQTPTAPLITPAGLGGVAYNEDGKVWVWNVNTSDWELIIS